jgi:hypothetical protein
MGQASLDQLSQAALGATNWLGDLNVPPSFRRAALAFANSNFGPDLGTTPPTAIPGGTIVNVQQTPVIAPLPADVQATLDRISQQTPGDLLGAVDGVRQAVSTAPPGLLAALEQVRSATADGSQRMLDLLNQVATAVAATQAPPTEASGTSSAATLSGRPSVSVTIGDIVVHVSGEGKDARAIGTDVAEQIVRRLERLGVLQTGNSQAFGPF